MGCRNKRKIRKLLAQDFFYNRLMYLLIFVFSRAGGVTKNLSKSLAIGRQAIAIFFGAQGTLEHMYLVTYRQFKL